MPGHSCLTPSKKQFDRLTRMTRKLFKLSLLILVSLTAGHTVFAQDLWNRLYVTNFGSHNVSVVDLNTSRVTAEIPVGFGPTGMAVTPNLEHIYVANFYGGSVSVISTASNSVEKTIPIPSGYGNSAPFGMAITPDGSQVFVTNLSDGTIRIISTQTNTVTTTVTAAYDWALRYIVISPDGQYVYAIGTGDGKITVLRVSDFSVVTTIRNLPSARHAVFTPDGSRLYVTGEKVNRLYVIDTTVNQLLYTFQFPNGSGTLTVDTESTGKFVLVSNYQGRVTKIDTDPRSLTYHQVTAEIPPNSGYQYCVAIAPDGRFAYLSNQSDRGRSPNSINIIDLNLDSSSYHTIIASIRVGLQPWGVAVLRQRPPIPNPSERCISQECIAKVFKRVPRLLMR